MLSLRSVQLSLVYVKTLMIQQVLTSLPGKIDSTPRPKGNHALGPTATSSYGSFQLDLNSQRLLIRRDSALNLLELNSCSDTTSKRADRLPPVAAMLRLPQHPKHHPLYPSWHRIDSKTSGVIDSERLSRIAVTSRRNFGGLGLHPGLRY